MKQIRANTLVTVGFLLSFIILYLYSHSITIFYGGIELLISAVCYGCFIVNYNYLETTLKKTCLVLVCIAFLMGILNANVKSTLLITTPLILPLFISSLNIDYSGKSRKFLLLAILVIAVCSYTIGTKTYNSNSIGFLTMMGVSCLFLWVKCAKYKIFPMAFIVFGLLLGASSGSRNVTIVGILCFCLLLMPRFIYNNNVLYWGLCGAVLVYTLLSADIMAWGFSNSTINKLLHDITSQYSQKDWDMVLRVDYLREIKNVIDSRGIIRNIFGDGILWYHGHNMFYQLILEYGYFGTGLIYLMFIKVFTIAHKLIRNNHDEIVRGCVIALLGNLLLQGADVYLLGTESYSIVPQLFMGIILQRYRVSQMEAVKLYD